MGKAIDQTLSCLDSFGYTIDTVDVGVMYFSVHLVLAHLKRTQKKEVIDHLMLKLPQALCLYQDYLKVDSVH